MKRTYLCPFCHAGLNPGTKIILRGELGGQKGLFLFSPKPGNYEVTIPDELRLQVQDRVTFSCPICGADLTSSRNDTMAEIRFTMPGSTGTLAFSRVYGQHETYVITEDAVKRFGEHASDQGRNYWGEGPDS
jgi:hypothetical protein